MNIGYNFDYKDTFLNIYLASNEKLKRKKKEKCVKSTIKTI